MAEHGRETFVEHVTTKKRRKHHMRKDDEVKYPFKDVGVAPGASSTTTSNAGTQGVKK
jgi:hypothetical protein